MNHYDFVNNCVEPLDETKLLKMCVNIYTELFWLM
jgi:hypothetical protein